MTFIHTKICSTIKARYAVTTYLCMWVWSIESARYYYYIGFSVWEKSGNAICAFWDRRSKIENSTENITTFAVHLYLHYFFNINDDQVLFFQWHLRLTFWALKQDVARFYCIKEKQKMTLSALHLNENRHEMVEVAIENCHF